MQLCFFSPTVTRQNWSPLGFTILEVIQTWAGNCKEKVERSACMLVGWNVACICVSCVYVRMRVCASWPDSPHRLQSQEMPYSLVYREIMWEPRTRRWRPPPGLSSLSVLQNFVSLSPLLFSVLRVFLLLCLLPPLLAAK